MKLCCPPTTFNYTALKYFISILNYLLPVSVLLKDAVYGQQVLPGGTPFLAPAPSIKSDTNAADVLTKNRYSPEQFRPALTEEARNRLLAIQGINHIEDKNVPKPDSNRGNVLNAMFGQDLSATLQATALPQNNGPFGQDLSETMLFNNKKQGAGNGPFAERNRLFTMGKYSEKDGDADLLESRSPLSSSDTTLRQSFDINAQGPNGLILTKKNSGIFYDHPSTSYPSISQSQNQMNHGPLDFSNFRNLATVTPIQMPAPAQMMSYSNNPSYNFPYNNNPVTVNQRPDVSVSRPQYATNSEISPASRVEISPVQDGGLAQRTSPLPGHDDRALGRYDTNIDRFSKASPNDNAVHRVVLNPMDPVFQPGVTLDSLLKRPTTFMQTPSNQPNQATQIPSQNFQRVPYQNPSNQWRNPNLSEHATNRPSQLFQERIDYVQQQQQLQTQRIGSGFAAADKIVASMPGVMKLESPIRAKTTILTNENVLPDETKTVVAQETTGITASPMSHNGNNSNSDTAIGPYTTYPDHRADLFPVLDNHAKEDTRPATGRRLGPQGRFGGGTNEYKEDWGHTAPNRGINDRREWWEKPPGAGTLIWNSSPLPPLNQYTSQVGIENMPPGPYPNRGASGQRRVILGDDLSENDPIGHIQFGKTVNMEFTTPAPYLYGKQTTTVIGVPLVDVSVRPTDVASDGRGLVGRFIGSGFNPTSERIMLPTEQRREGRIDEYFGPEELTGSRYRQLDEVRQRDIGGTSGRGPNRYVKMELLNE
ncbi:hypothetical protein DdX_00333 [Ditylenchus destructor]|uniref:Uncharacterized protein n=1 Tax=Ditylenchus destructor TaxID=166010 RepID=A0AAD4NJQ9_9BILA|nr:hypothetical protein DdX_00333 [Ditylenchus destructor]